MNDIPRCENLTLCYTELSRAYVDLSQQLSEDEINGDHADDATWILSASFIILTMQSGFGLLEMGSAAAGNEVNIMMKNAADVIFGSLAYYFLGYGISFGQPSIPFMGLGDFAPDGADMESESGLLYSRYIFQLSFAATATTIVSGMVAMRMRFFVYCLFSFVAIIAYAFVAHWAWASDGWLRTMGAYDFAGAGVVHLFGGTNGLVAIYFLGPRRGRFDGTRPKSDFRPVSQSSMLFGLFMLWWGWIGFNCGSTFGITGDKWIVATRAAITTVSSTGAGGAAAMAYSMYKTGGKMLNVEDVVNGILGSLVTSSAVCAVIHTYESLLLGAAGALVALAANKLVLRLRLDDVVGAAGVHFGAGIWGLISVGLFADGNLPGVDVSSGLFRGGGMRLLGLQVLLIVAVSAWALMFSSLFFYLTGVAISRDWKNPRAGLRVSPEEEERGADLAFHGVDPLGEEDDEYSHSTNGTETGKVEICDIDSTMEKKERKFAQNESPNANLSNRTVDDACSVEHEMEEEKLEVVGSAQSLALHSEVEIREEDDTPNADEKQMDAVLPNTKCETDSFDLEDEFRENPDIEAAIHSAAAQLPHPCPMLPPVTSDSISTDRRRSKEAGSDRRKCMKRASEKRKSMQSRRILL
uniref:Ammonium transporter AmtB-like domain-containing protein n=1 Tax=Pseudictyota dubia TaxID=2749911 RepID=A0A7R9ZE92_9STRA|mmetsp:Transcript_45289/g.83773  ORF Transcript_45289/g.83773 Transcript_45289/m.83773 type:complete len:638 (+) Transcript_45289:100-2013(+)